jgi:hypothetical protein
MTVCVNKWTTWTKGFNKKWWTKWHETFCTHERGCLNTYDNRFERTNRSIKKIYRNFGWIIYFKLRIPTFKFYVQSQTLIAKVTKVFIGKIRAKKLSNYKSQGSITGATKVLELTRRKRRKWEKRRGPWCYHYTPPCCTHWKQPKA